MKKLKTMLIACLCAVTTFVTFGAVKSAATVRADDATTDYIYRDTTVASVSVNDALTTYPRLELTGTDFKDSNGTYNKGKDYTTVNSLNTFTKIKVDGTAAGSVWDGNITDPYLNMYDNSVDRFAFKFTDFPTATEIVIEEGCEFPSYALWSGTGDKIVYKTTETSTFKKVDGVWVKQVSDNFRYIDTDVTSLTAIDGWDALGFMWFNLSVCDYAGADKYDKGKNYTYINALNTLSHIKVGETAVGGEWNKDTSDPYINLYANNAFTFKSAAFVSATEITVEAGCEFPSYARWNAGSSVVYRTTEDVTFRKVNGAWYKVYTATFVDETGNELGKATFTTADTALTYPTYEADPAYDYAWKNNEIKAENITVTLTKTIKTFDVIIGEAAAVKYNYGSKITAPAEEPTKTKDGYTVTFDGWYNGDTKWNFDTDTVKGNVTLVAKFNETARKYTVTVTFDGLEKDTVTLQVEYNGTVDFSAYAEDGYNMTIKNGETEIDGLTVTGDVNITVTYAKKPAADKKGCGGSVNGVMPVLAILCLAGAVAVIKKKRV